MDKPVFFNVLAMPARRISEGFRGQRLVVLPDPVRARAQIHPLLRGLLVTDAGIFPRAKSHFIERKQGAPTTLLIACLAGEGWVRLNGSVLKVGTGMLVWLPANRPHAYGASGKKPWTIEWAHFQGEETDAWREMLHIPLEGCVLRMSSSSIADLRLGQVWAHLDHGYTLPSLVAAAAALRGACAAVAQTQSPDSPQSTSQERVIASMAWMKERLREPLRLEELARYAGLSVPHYTVLFRRYSGFSPMDWFSRLRIMRASEMLDTTQRPIAEIAHETGFSDPYYFTRCFRRVIGLSPRRYRQIPKG